MMLRNRGRFGLERALWYDWRDQYDPTCLWCRTAGLIHNTFERKPAYGAFRALANPARRSPRGRQDQAGSPPPTTQGRR